MDWATAHLAQARGTRLSEKSWPDEYVSSNSPPRREMFMLGARRSRPSEMSSPKRGFESKPLWHARSVTKA